MAEKKLVLSNERTLFMLNWNSRHHGESGNSVFSDELTDYTFFPYVNVRNIPQDLEEINLSLYMEENDKLIQFPCIYDAQRKEIYLTVTDFNKYWREIYRRIYKATHAAAITVNELTNEKMNDMVDLSLLETATRSAFINQTFQIEYKGKEIDIDTQRLISKKAYALENPEIKFVYSSQNSYIHDKSCSFVNDIAPKHFGALEKLPEDRTLCQRCAKKIYIRNAIQNDNKNFAMYLHFFDKGRVGFRLIEQFLWHDKAKIYMPERNVMQVVYKEDTWIIRMHDKGKCTLEHNNYAIIENTDRKMLSGFHPQKCSHTYLPGMIRYIQEYDWKEHLELRLAREQAEKVIAKDGMLRRIIKWFHMLSNKRR